MNAHALGIAIGAAILAIVALIMSDHAAMKVCQIDHSFDVCHEALNR